MNRLAAKGLADYQGQVHCAGRKWLATQSVNLLEHNLSKPLLWRKPRFVFVNSKSDLFDERVPFEFIAKVFDMMAATPRHRFMVLTKEPGRMDEFVEWYMVRSEPLWPADFWNVILMVSVEGPQYIDRVNTLMNMPAVMRGVSIEPYIEPMGQALWPYLYERPATSDEPRLDWVIVGCEKMPGGRPGRWAALDPDAWWGAAAMLAKTCRQTGTPLWMKQGPGLPTKATGFHIQTATKVTTDLAQFPPSCRIQERPWRARG